MFSLFWHSGHSCGCWVSQGAYKFPLLLERGVFSKLLTPDPSEDQEPEPVKCS